MEYRTNQMAAEAVLAALRPLCKQKERVLLAIDGRCGAGKTSLAAALKTKLNCPVIPMDGFFLRPEQRTEARLAEPGGNVDRERFFLEVLQPLQSGVPFSYRPYVCREDALGEPVFVSPAPVCVIEGSYSCHPLLRDAYDLRVFLTVDPAAQMARIKKRNGAACARRFAETWIPLEERYFREANVAACCQLQLST